MSDAEEKQIGKIDDWLKECRLEKYSKKFIQENWTKVEDLLKIDDINLFVTNELNITKQIDKNRMISAVQQYQNR